MNNKSIQMSNALYAYLLEHSLREHPVLAAIRQANQQDDMLSRMQVAPEQGQFMAMLLQLINAKRVIEVGTSTGYSALSMALALPDEGELIACDINEKVIKLAQGFWQQAGVEHKITARVGPALNTLHDLLDNNQAGRFDFAFIDADKTTYDAYYEACLKLLRPGGVIVIDNVLWGGAVIDSNEQDDDTCAIRTLNNKLLCDERVSLSMLPVADGLTILHKR